MDQNFVHYPLSLLSLTFSYLHLELLHSPSLSFSLHSLTLCLFSSLFRCVDISAATSLLQHVALALSLYNSQYYLIYQVPNREVSQKECIASLFSFGRWCRADYP
jgi:hypothetical protein